MAAHVLSMTDGTTSISLNVPGANMVLDYPMETPDTSKSDLENEPQITETLSIVLAATTSALLHTVIGSVNAMIVAALRRQKKQTGPRVYLLMTADGDASTWRAEIIDGKPFKPGKDFLKWGFANLRAEGELFITHRLWEGQEVELLLSTTASTAATGGKTIYNHDDGDAGHDNMVSIAAGQVLGDVPTPVRVVLTNTSGVSVNYRNLYLSTNALSDPANFVHILEAESRTSGGTVSADASMSNGSYNSLAFTTTGQILYTLTAAQMQKTQGRWFHLLMRPKFWTGTDIYIRPILREKTGSSNLYEGDEIHLPASSGTNLLDLGSLPLPNGGYQVAWDAMTLVLQLRATGAATFEHDFIQLTPLDAYQFIVQRGFTLANNDTITIDNIEGIVHTLGTPIYSPRSGPLRVFPNTTTPQRIIVLSDEGVSSDIAKTMKIQAFIRPRRFTV